MKFLNLFAAMLLCGSMAYAQQADPVVMKINGMPILRSEFEYSYNKNNSDDVIDKKTVDEYVDLFINDAYTEDEIKLYNQMLAEIYGDETYIGNDYSFDEIDPARLLQLRDEGKLPFVRTDITRALRQQIVLGDSTLTTDMNDILDTTSLLIYGSSYEDITEYQKKIVKS